MLPLALALAVAAQPLVSHSADRAVSEAAAFAAERRSLPFWLADLPELAPLETRGRDVVLYRGSVKAPAEVGRVPLGRGTADRSESSPTQVTVQPRPPGPDAIRTLALGLDLLDSAKPNALSHRLGRWRIEAMVAEDAPLRRDPSASWRRATDREMGVRVRGRALSQRLRTTYAVTRLSGPTFSSESAPQHGWSEELEPAHVDSETLEAAFDLVRSYPVWSDRVATLTATARRSSLTYTRRGGSAFPDTDPLFSEGSSEHPVVAVAVAGWQASSRQWSAPRDLAEEIASTNLRLSLFPWLAEAREGSRWGAAIDQGFQRLRRLRDHDDRSGDAEDVHSLGAAWWLGATSLGYRRAVCVAGEEEGRISHTVNAAVRPVSSLGVHAYVSRGSRAARHGEAALETRDVGGGVDWQFARGWTFWGGSQSSRYRCGHDCSGITGSLDMQLARELEFAAGGRKLQAKVFAGGGKQRIASAYPSTGTTDDDYWRVGAGISVTF